MGGDLVSTWITKHKAHAEDVAKPRKKRYKIILANKTRKFAVAANDSFFNEAAVALAA